MIEIIVTGLNHKTAPIEIRERLSFQESELEEALLRVNLLPSIKENIILSTCNRVEIYAVTRNPETAIRELKEFLSQYHNIPLIDFERSIYSFISDEAVRHIFRVASSLDSMVVGEPQILGQIKNAYNIAMELKTSGFILHRLLHRAFHVAKRVRNETKISLSAVSVSSVAVDLAQKIFGNLEKKNILLVGAGEMSELAARHFISAGVEKIVITNRTFERALSLAKEFKGEAIPFEDINKGLKNADIVLSATDSPQYIIQYEQMIKVMKERKQKPIFLIDISDPRNIEPRVGNIENIYLYNIDDLQNIAKENIKDREKEAQKAESIIQEELIKFVKWYQSLQLTPTIVALRKKFDEIRKKELEKMLSMHPNLSEKERKSLEAMTLAIINKILHDPLTQLKKRDEDIVAELYIDAIRTLFQLSSTNTNISKEEEEINARI
jgi:glutamyl-tRNA reductase